MTYPSVTALYAALLALLFMAISMWVVTGRAKYRIIIGDGGNDQFVRRMRAQANFVEYVPLILLLMALFEAGGGSRTICHALLLPLLVARAAHPFGMAARDGTPVHYACRGGGAMVTWIVLVASAVLLLVRVV